jgi:hypothetical protein
MSVNEGLTDETPQTPGAIERLRQAAAHLEAHPTAMAGAAPALARIIAHDARVSAMMDPDDPAAADEWVDADVLALADWVLAEVQP